MNDSFSGKNGKVKVMYVRPEGESERSSTGRHNKDSRADRRGTRDKVSRSDSSYQPAKPVRSAWQERFKGEEQQATFEPRKRTGSYPHSQIEQTSPATIDTTEASTKPAIDPAQLRRQRNEETRIYGENACQALFAHRADSIVRAYFLQEVTPRFRDALRWMAANRKAYHVVDEAEMQKVSGTEHHGGVCFLIKKRSGLSVADYLVTAGNKDCVLVLDQIENPYNLGGIIRSAAFFGVNAAVLRNPDHMDSGAATRTADGGAEHVKAIVADDLSLAIDMFRRSGYLVVALSTHAAHKESVPFGQVKFPAKTVFVISQETASTIKNNSDHIVHIAGTQQIDSLNISVSAGVLLAGWYSQNN